MAYIRIKGLPGRIYVPDEVGPRKHNCKDCYFCQWCSDDRCELCLKEQGKKKRGGCCKKKRKTKES